MEDLRLSPQQSARSSLFQFRLCLGSVLTQDASWFSKAAKTHNDLSGRQQPLLKEAVTSYYSPATLQLSQTRSNPLCIVRHCPHLIAPPDRDCPASYRPLRTLHRRPNIDLTSERNYTHRSDLSQRQVHLFVPCGACLVAAATAVSSSNDNNSSTQR